MKKDFLGWADVKTVLQKRENLPLFRESEVWWCSLGSNLGFEEDGKNDAFERPVIIYKKFSRELFLGVPITSKVREGRYYYGFILDDLPRTALLSQIRVLSVRRLRRRTGCLGGSQWQEFRVALLACIQ